MFSFLYDPDMHDLPQFSSKRCLGGTAGSALRWTVTYWVSAYGDGSHKQHFVQTVGLIWSMANGPFQS